MTQSEYCGRRTVFLRHESEPETEPEPEPEPETPEEQTDCSSVENDLKDCETEAARLIEELKKCKQNQDECDFDLEDCQANMESLQDIFKGKESDLQNQLNECREKCSANSLSAAWKRTEASLKLCPKIDQTVRTHKGVSSVQDLVSAVGG